MLDRVVVGVAILIGFLGSLLFAFLLLGYDMYDLRDQCTTQLYTGIRVCDRLK